MASDLRMQLGALVESIKAHRTTVDSEARRLRTSEILASFDRRRHRSWCLAVMGDGLVRVRLLLEQNFNFIETIGIVAVSRYLFELSVWLHLFEHDERYGLVYYGQLLETQQKYFVDFRAQLGREIEMLREFEKKDKDAQRAVMSQAGPSKDLASRLRSTAQMIDAEAARQFSLYADQAKVNGYGFQAHLVEKNAVLEVESSLAALRAEQVRFDANVLPEIKDLALTKKGKKKRWEWKEKAEAVGLLNEYDFLYATASKLLHATPVSITTDHKNLEPGEFVVFLKYIDVKTIEIINLARMYPRDAA